MKDQECGTKKKGDVELTSGTTKLMAVGAKVDLQTQRANTRFKH